MKHILQHTGVCVRCKLLINFVASSHCLTPFMTSFCTEALKHTYRYCSTFLHKPKRRGTEHFYTSVLCSVLLVRNVYTFIDLHTNAPSLLITSSINARTNSPTHWRSNFLAVCSHIPASIHLVHSLVFSYGDESFATIASWKTGRKYY